MELAQVTLQQVGILFILIFLGFFCGKLKIITQEGKQVLSNLLVQIILPAMVLNSYFSEFDPEVLNNLLLAFFWSTVAIVIAMAISALFVFLRKTNQKKLLWFALSFSNAAFMGFPLIQGLFGTEGLLYASAFVTMFNVFVWSVGYAVMSGEKNVGQIGKSIGKNPVTYAVLVGLLIYLCRIPVPEVIRQPVSLVGTMTTPLSMLIIGVMIAQSKISNILGNKEIWFASFIRLVLIPAVTVVLFSVCGVSGMVKSVVLILAACPTAAITSVLAVQFHHDEVVGAGTVVLSTILSIVTLTVLVLVI